MSSLDRMDYEEPRCFCDTEFYKEKSAVSPAKGHIRIDEMIAAVDRLYRRGDKAAIERVLEGYASEAKALGDTRGELTAVNELLGHYRMTANREKGLSAVERCTELLAMAQIGGSVSAGTILLNAATALRSFGESKRALTLYAEAGRAYADHLPPSDTRFAGLYNNMASAYEDEGEPDRAEKYYQTALSILGAHPDDTGCLLDAAVTHLNLAQLYTAHDPADSRIAEHAETAMQILSDQALFDDYYYAHTAEKCADGFAYLGYFLFAEELKERAASYYRERT